MSLILDGIDIRKEFNIRSRLSSQYPASPDLRNKSLTILNMPGVHDMGADLEPMVFDWECDVIEATQLDLQQTARDLKAILFDQFGKPKTVKMAFSFEQEKEYEARIDASINLERTVPLGVFQLPLIAYDPFAYNKLLQDEIVWGSETITFEDNYLLGHKGATPQTEVTAPTSLYYWCQSYAVKPVIEISGSADNLTITNGDQVINFPNFTDTEWIIDCPEYEVYRNGEQDYDAIKLRDFWLYQGKNDVRINGNNIDISIRTKYRDRFL